jgi:hypothetical protein
MFYCRIFEYVHVNGTEHHTQLYGMLPNPVMIKMLADMLLCRLLHILECKIKHVPARHLWKMLHQLASSHTKRKYTLSQAEFEPPVYKISQ